MKKRKTWKSKLTKKELKHLTESGVTTKASFQRTIDEQQRQRIQFPDASDPCFECKMIAHKLGMEPSI